MDKNSENTGLIIITGSTNTNKATSLQAILHLLGNSERIAYNIEDPIEIILP